MTNLATPSRPTLTNWIEIAALGVIWGASFLSVHVALTGFGPLTVAGEYPAYTADPAFDAPPPYKMLDLARRLGGTP